ARKMSLKINDEITVSVRKPTFLPTDSPFSTGNDYTGFRLKVQGIVDKESFGNFSLTISPETPPGIFVSRTYLAAKLDSAGRVNTLLVAGDGRLKTADIERAFASAWTLEDTGLSITEIPGKDVFELRTRRVFISKNSIEIIRNSFPEAEYIFSYFVNSIRKNGRSVPYSILSAPPRAAGGSLPEDGIIINSWLAGDLEAGKGDRIELEYYVIDQKRNLQVKKSDFTVHSVIPVDSTGDGKTLMPDFPGLTAAGTCRDWSPGIPIDLDKIRVRDERYWDTYRGTPKAFIGLPKAQKIWGNQFGDITSIRFKLADKQTIIETLQSRLGPGTFGHQFEDIRNLQVRSSEESVDFSQLFLGLSFFIVLSSLILTGLFFVLYLETRSREIGTLYALGYGKTMICRLFLSEGALIAAGGSLMGIVAGILYNHAFIYGLSNVWHDAVRAETLGVSIEPLTVLKGFVLSAVFSVTAMYLSLRSLLKKSVDRILRGLTEERPGKKHVSALQKRLCAGLPVIIVLLFAYTGLVKGDYPPVLFFTAGSLLLIEGLLAASILLQKLTSGSTGTALSAPALGLRNISRNPRRSLSVIGLLSVGIFMVMSVAANRSNYDPETLGRMSGTGGFSLFCRTTYPINTNLNTVDGRKKAGLREDLYDGITFAQMRLREGDDASCLNPNRTFTPRVLGVDPATFATREAFTFSGVLKQYKTKEGTTGGAVWPLLETDLPDGSIPAIADQAVIQWGLGKSLGDSIVLSDENGRPVKLKLIAGLANSVFQGYVIISEKHFLKHFPSKSGFGVFLVDRIDNGHEDINNDLSRAFLTHGIEVTGTAERLSEFSAVQDAYLSIFLILGGFGLILGTIGLGILIVRNVLERRGELALHQALGYTKRIILKMLLYEYLFLLVPGIVIGGVSACLAVAPLLAAPGTRVPHNVLLLDVLLIAAVGMASIYSAGTHAVKGDLLPGLRGE
ncbi:MAG: FtsX-like permease family protein, partial [bacterium]|nr:FtsX-like permease family protein [bacterium]